MPEVINKNTHTKTKQEEKKKYEFDFDELQMFFSEPYLIQMENGKYIEIKQPSIGDILSIGDRKVYSYISPLIHNTTSYRVQLWEMGKDWNKISDYELFSALVVCINNVEFLLKKVEFIKNQNYNETLSKEKNLELGNEEYIKLYKDINFTTLQQYERAKSNENGEIYKEIFLYDPNQDIIITEETYMHIREYIRKMFDQYPKEEFAKGKLAKQWIINEEKEKIKLANEKKTKTKSILLPMVSSLLNHPGFKYDLDGMKKLGIFAFMDSVRRLQVYEQCTAFMQGMYSGMMDTSKLGQEELNKRINWLQDIYEE